MTQRSVFVYPKLPFPLPKPPDRRLRPNVHWFKAESETAFIFNIHVGDYNLENKKTANRVYVDPEGEKVAGGLIVAKKVSSSECHKKYG
jgi:hypothetical protein